MVNMRSRKPLTPGYSLSPDLTNAATVSVSLIEGNRRKDSQIGGKMVLKRQDLEILWSQFFLYSMSPTIKFFGPSLVSMNCKHEYFWKFFLGAHLCQNILKYYIQMVTHIKSNQSKFSIYNYYLEDFCESSSHHRQIISVQLLSVKIVPRYYHIFLVSQDIITFFSSKRNGNWHVYNDFRRILHFPNCLLFQYSLVFSKVYNLNWIFMLCFLLLRLLL